MGLITETVETTWVNSNKNWYISRGYSFTKIRNKLIVKTKDLPKGSNIKVKCSCDNCNKEYDIIWQNYNKFLKGDGNIYCSSCAMKLYGTENMRKSRLKNGTTFEQWCIDNNEQYILNLWDYKLNKYKPDEIGYGSDRKYWFKCPRGIHESESKEVNTFTSKKENSIKCNKCNSFGQHLLDNYGEDAIEKYWGDKNIHSSFEVSRGSKYNVWLKCPDCDNEKPIPPYRFIRQGLGCSKCGDGISYPNKFMYNVLESFNIKFITEFSQAWSNSRKYDFYFELDNNKYIIEMDGALGHGNKDNNMSGLTKEESKDIDDYKDKLAKEHDIKVIRIDCNYTGHSRFEYIKNNTLQSQLVDMFDFSNVNWTQCNVYASSTLVKTVCEIWNMGDKSLVDIAELLNITSATVRNYLKQGIELRWCYYNGDEELKRNTLKQSKKVYCIELDKIFDSINKASNELNLQHKAISNCCHNKPKYKSAGGYHWMFYEDYLKSQQKSA